MQLDDLHEGDVDEQLLVRVAGEVQPFVLPVALKTTNRQNAIASEIGKSVTAPPYIFYETLETAGRKIGPSVSENPLDRSGDLGNERPEVPA